jgi:hypothetical protein
MCVLVLIDWTTVHAKSFAFASEKGLIRQRPAAA